MMSILQTTRTYKKIEVSMETTWNLQYNYMMLPADSKQQGEKIGDEALTKGGLDVRKRQGYISPNQHYVATRRTNQEIKKKETK